jgi:hypothetical protein
MVEEPRQILKDWRISQTPELKRRYAHTTDYLLVSWMIGICSSKKLLHSRNDFNVFENTRAHPTLLNELIPVQCAWGGGALPFANSSLNVPADFSWYSKFD